MVALSILTHSLTHCLFRCACNIESCRQSTLSYANLIAQHLNQPNVMMVIRYYYTDILHLSMPQQCPVSRVASNHASRWRFGRPGMQHCEHCWLLLLLLLRVVTSTAVGRKYYNWIGTRLVGHSSGLRCSLANVAAIALRSVGDRVRRKLVLATEREFGSAFDTRARMATIALDDARGFGDLDQSATRNTRKQVQCPQAGRCAWVNVLTSRRLPPLRQQQ
jgi:hypothetical protein